MTLDYDGWIILIGVLVAVACAIPGTWLVVRGMGMMGDAISHAVLPGIALGFLISGSRDGGWMFAGAAVAGGATRRATVMMLPTASKHATHVAAVKIMTP